MILIKYRFLVNMRMDRAGHSTSFLHGYRPGDRLALAYKGEIEAPASDFSQEDIDHFAAHLLFRWFNVERSGDIANYRGPSMSVGDVVEIDGRAYAVDSAGFARIEDLRREQIVPGPADWLRPPEL